MAKIFLLNPNGYSKDFSINFHSIFIYSKNNAPKMLYIILSDENAMNGKDIPENIMVNKLPNIK